MIDDGLLDELAGEYVLGTLDGEARNRLLLARIRGTFSVSETSSRICKHA